MKNKIITYSLLAHIRNNNGNKNSIKSSLDIFIPLIKRVLAKLNSKGIVKGKNISEIKVFVDEEYGLDFPIPVLTLILTQISKEVNTETENKFVIYKDNSFSISEYVFDDYEEIISERTKKIENVQKLFEEFKKGQIEHNFNTESIFKFIEKNKYSLSKYLNGNVEVSSQDFNIEAKFISFFKETEVYEIIKDIYLGAILSCYIEYKPNILSSTKAIELLLDTNFIVGLLDLNTKESTHTCRTLIKIAKNSGYSVSALKSTIEETKNLLKNRADNFDKSFLQNMINPEDVFNACERRNLKKSDLEKISDNIEESLNHYGIEIKDIKYNIDSIKKTKEYKYLREIRNSEASAIHDVTAITYVKNQRNNKSIKKFEDVNCWFVNNSFSPTHSVLENKKGHQPEEIKVDVLLNILWLSNPSINKDTKEDDLVNIGLMSSISLTLNQNLPKAKVLKELDENIYKYAKDTISDEDIVRISNRIVDKQLTDLDVENLNKLAEDNKEDFVLKLREESSKQKSKEEKITQNMDRMFKLLHSQIKKIVDTEKSIENKYEDDKKELVAKDEELKKLRKEKQHRLEEDYKTKEVKKWRKKQWICFGLWSIPLIIYIIILLYFGDWNLINAIEIYRNNPFINIIFSLITSIITGVGIKNLNDSYNNPSAIKAFKDLINLPDNLK